MTISSIFHQFQNLKVAILGDVMLDSYCWGSVERISPEAPVPIVSVNKEEYRIGGAGNVALNIAALTAQPFVFSVIGQDKEADVLLQLMNSQHINTDNILKTANRKTTNKTRIMARNQQVLRLDNEHNNDIDTATEKILLEKLASFFEKEQPQLLILEDYNKGVLSAPVIKKAIALAKAHNIIVSVDPKRKNFFAYQQVDIFKPNLKEVTEALNIVLEQVDKTGLNQLHQSLHQQLQHRFSLITLSEKGVFIQEAGQEPTILPAKIRNIADVSGAGDTVIAVLSAVYAIAKDILLAAEIANIAGGLVCEEVGTVAINKQLLLDEANKFLKIVHT